MRRPRIAPPATQSTAPKHDKYRFGEARTVSRGFTVERAHAPRMSTPENPSPIPIRRMSTSLRRRPQHGTRPPPIASTPPIRSRRQSQTRALGTHLVETACTLQSGASGRCHLMGSGHRGGSAATSLHGPLRHRRSGGLAGVPPAPGHYGVDSGHPCGDYSAAPGRH